MTMRRIGLLLGILMLLLVPRPAHAELVVGASAGMAGVDIEEVEFDESDFSWKAYGGFRFLKFLGLKAEYLDLGAPEGDLGGIGEVSFDLTGWDVLAEGVLPLGEHFELFVTAGYVFWDFESSVSSVFDNDEDGGEDFMYGAGAAFIFNELVGIRLEWQRFEAETANVDFVTAGIDFRF
jgi:OOP family OmpA-OmpF porin